MPREHWNDIPGDVAAGSSENLPGGFGTYDPDADPNAMIDEMTENDVIGPDGKVFMASEQRGGETTGTSYAEGVETGETVDPADLVE